MKLSQLSAMVPDFNFTQYLGKLSSDNDNGNFLGLTSITRSHSSETDRETLYPFLSHHFNPALFSCQDVRMVVGPCQNKV